MIVLLFLLSFRRFLGLILIYKAPLNRVPFLECKFFLVCCDLLGNNGGRATSIILERHSNLADMRRIILVVLMVAAYDVLSARFELTEARVDEVLRCVLQNGVIIRTPVHFGLPLGA